MPTLKRRREPPDQEYWEIIRAAKKSRSIGQAKDIVKIIVGPEDCSSTNFYFHHDHLTAYSEIFKAALSADNWREAQEGIIRMPEDDAAHFEAFSTFVYTGIIDRTDSTGKADSTDDGYKIIGPDGSSERDRLVQLWLFGDKLMSQSFKDAVIDVLAFNVSFCKGNVNLHKQAYPATAGPNALRRLAVDSALLCWSEGGLATAEMTWLGVKFSGMSPFGPRGRKHRT